MVQKATKVVGGPAIYDFGDRALWFAEGLDIPLNVKYSGLRRGRSILGSAYTTLPSGETSIFGPVETDLVELECYVSKKMLESSQAMYKETMPMASKSKPINFMASFERFLFGNDDQK